MLSNLARAALVSSSFTVACLTAIVLMSGSACLAQVAGGTISGRVIDSSGRGIAGAQVAVKNSETAILRSLGADNDGIYTAPNLVAGSYQISASKQGFAMQRSLSSEGEIAARLSPPSFGPDDKIVYYPRHLARSKGG
jgi:carboxypeptidase family protein